MREPCCGQAGNLLSQQAPVAAAFAGLPAKACRARWQRRLGGAAGRDERAATGCGGGSLPCCGLNRPLVVRLPSSRTVSSMGSLGRAVCASQGVGGSSKKAALFTRASSLLRVATRRRDAAGGGLQANLAAVEVGRPLGRTSAAAI